MTRFMNSSAQCQEPAPAFRQPHVSRRGLLARLAAKSAVRPHAPSTASSMLANQLTFGTLSIAQPERAFQPTRTIIRRSSIEQRPLVFFHPFAKMDLRARKSFSALFIGGECSWGLYSCSWADWSALRRAGLPRCRGSASAACSRRCWRCRCGTKLAVAAVAIPHAAGTALRFWLLRKAIDRRVLWSFGLTSAAGGLLGALLHRYAAGRALTLVFACLLIFAGVAGADGPGAAAAVQGAGGVGRRRAFRRVRRTGREPGRNPLGGDVRRSTCRATRSSPRPRPSR